MHSDFRLSVLARWRVWAAPLWLQVRDFCRESVQDMPLLTRVGSHIGLILLVAAALVASQIQFPTGNLNVRDSATEELLTERTEVLNVESNNESVMSAPNPLTIAPKRVRNDVIKYIVQSGDTVSEVAAQFEVSPDSILWANPKLEDNPDMLSLGQSLNIPPVSGVLYVVQNGDTLRKVADKFKGKKKSDAILQDIVNSEFNQKRHDLRASEPALTVGQFLIVPGGNKPYVPRIVQAYSGSVPASAARGTGNFGWPVSGRITQKFWTQHSALDIAAPKGTPIYATDSGYVVRTESKTTGYGNMILIDHGNGYVTRYAHLSAIHVEVGESVKKGQLIGRVGSTGNTTGPHLHFEVIRNSVARNPFNYLPGR